MNQPLSACAVLGLGISVCIGLHGAAFGATPAADPGEPAVKYTVIEGEGARIEELRVRGQTQRITVTPKGRGKPYEIIPPAGSQDLQEAPNGVKGAAGKRVWHVLSF